jgi:hypothetical protein
LPNWSRLWPVGKTGRLSSGHLYVDTN